MRNQTRYYLLMAAAVALMLSGCGLFSAQEDQAEDTPVPEPTATVIPPTPTPPPPETLIVCLQEEPDSLYLYGAVSREADAVLQAVYDGPFDLLDYTFESVILEAMPDLSSGGVQVNSVTVRSGDRYLNPATLLPDTFRYGKPYRPAGCSSPQCQQSFVGGEVQMDQLEVAFQLRGGITWSDGTPLTAADSVFSFDLDRHPDTPGSKYVVDRTQAYEAVDDLQVRWVGIPGFLDPDYRANFWSPLPQHLLEGIEPGDLLESEAARQPVGWGPYVLESWQDKEIILSSNPLYFRAEEGFPAFERLVFRFLEGDSGSALEQLVTGECDVLDETLTPFSAIENVIDLSDQGQIGFSWASGSVIERIDFNTSPLNTAASKILADVQLRQAIAACINREGLVSEVLSGLGAVPDTYLPSTYPLAAMETTYPSYDPAAARSQLEQLGWLDVEDDGLDVRVAQGVWNVATGTPLSFTMHVVDGGLQRNIATAIQRDLVECGIELAVEYGSSADLFAAYPDGTIFSRNFESVMWAWPVFSSPPCEMYETAQIPSDTTRYGINAAGFSNSAYDGACGAIQLGLPGSSGYEEAAVQTARVLAEALPGLPLIERPRIAAYAADLCGIDVNPSAFSVLWNLEEYQRGEACLPRD